MKPVEQYKCEICGGIYETAKKATDCENKHAHIVKIEPLFSPNHVAPDAVRVYTEKEGKRTQKTYSLYRYY
ncbi:MAG: hypothetical protein WDA59_05430 [Methanofastidiosum sp.]|jgi:hypothetical protein